MPKSNKANQAKSKIRKGIYLDYASSVEPNASSIHQEGVLSKRKLEDARTRVSVVLSARPKQIIFTSGGTESNNIAILGTINKFTPVSGIKPHIITTNIEHPSVLESCKELESRGQVELSIVPVEKNGIVDPKKIKKEIKENTVLVSVMYANNEIGTIQPIKEIAKEIRHWRKMSKGFALPLFHTDAVQASNYLDLNIEKLGVDLLSLSGSKIEGSGKVGLLYTRDISALSPVFFGGDQEMGLRPGTENVADITKFATALEYSQKIKDKESHRLIVLRDYFFEKLKKLTDDMIVGGMIVNGDLENRLPNNVNITIRNMPSDLLVIELSAYGIYVSSKSACKSGDGKVSHVIKAIHPEIKETDGSLRFSFGRNTSKEDLVYSLKALAGIFTKLEKWYN